MTAADLDDHERNTGLLAAELPARRYVDAGYLRWLYDASPYGPAITRQLDDHGVRVAHYAMIPQRYRNADGAVPSAFSLHAVVRTGTQRKGLFRTLGQEVIDAASAAGWRFATGVCNEKSIGTVVKYLGWKTPGPLPVKVCVPLHRGRGVESVAVDDDFRTRDLPGIAHDLDDVPVRTWTNTASPEYLQWRLASPYASYAVHVSSDLVAISTTDTGFGVRAAVILKLMPRGGRGGPLPADAVIGAACRFHRAPYAVYAGFNEHVRVRGFTPPRRLQPSPLNFILRSLSDDVDQETLAVDTFEFLDMDAY
jgi:hypothetical protein